MTSRISKSVIDVISPFPQEEANSRKYPGQRTEAMACPSIVVRKKGETNLIAVKYGNEFIKLDTICRSTKKGYHAPTPAKIERDWSNIMPKSQSNQKG